MYGGNTGYKGQIRYMRSSELPRMVGMVVGMAAGTGCADPGCERCNPDHVGLPLELVVVLVNELLPLGNHFRQQYISPKNKANNGYLYI